MCTFDMAHAWGLEDRGLLVPGRAADLVIFDPDTVGPLPPEYVRDLPGGGRRLVQRANGITNSIVNGVVAFSDCESTGEFAGTVPTRTRAPEPTFTNYLGFHKPTNRRSTRRE